MSTGTFRNYFIPEEGQQLLQMYIEEYKKYLNQLKDQNLPDSSPFFVAGSNYRHQTQKIKQISRTLFDKQLSTLFSLLKKQSSWVD